LSHFFARRREEREQQRRKSALNALFDGAYQY